MYLCYEKSRVAGATRDNYITYRTDTGRSAVYVFVFVFFLLNQLQTHTYYRYMINEFIH